MKGKIFRRAKNIEAIQLSKGERRKVNATKKNSSAFPLLVKWGGGFLDFDICKYDEEIGRFTSIDPMLEKQKQWNPYHYAENNPINKSDPSGEIPGLAILAIKVASAAAIEYGTQVADNLINNPHGDNIGEVLGNACYNDVDGTDVKVAFFVGAAIPIAGGGSLVKNVLKAGVVNTVESAVQSQVGSKTSDFTLWNVGFSFGSAFVGTAVSNKVYSKAQTSPEGKNLNHKAEVSEKIADQRGRSAQVKKAAAVRKVASSYGQMGAYTAGKASEGTLKGFQSALKGVQTGIFIQVTGFKPLW